MNYIQSIVKILESPKSTKLNITKFRAQLPKNKHGSQIVILILRGNLAKTILKYYEKNDYIMIEGYVSVKIQTSLNLVNKSFKKVEITVLKVYPFLLTSNSFLQKS
uniref:hypothetical chloroplast RF41 n=1 Tax=Haslea pseudostrearia TaxID=197756 RepID=UPI002202FA49|nr:hypothetical chloroplast RF41 [Haslea pseudostrearia]UXN44593.1 hypothetical chloroplast RF41 [Haslea pseudostrearia]